MRSSAHGSRDKGIPFAIENVLRTWLAIKSFGDTLWEAFQEACKKGTRPSYRARINIIGHSGAGKTSLTRRLLGKSFQKNEESTEGIETHRIEFSIDKEERATKRTWVEAQLRPEELVQTFNQDVLQRRTSETSAVADQEPWLPNKSTDKFAPKSDTDPVRQEVVQNLQTFEQRQEKALAEQKKSQSGSQLLKKLVTQKTSSRDETKGARSEGEATPTHETCILRLWDFGGQTEFYTTHHMFLDAEAINIIVMDMSKDIRSKMVKEELAVEIPNTPEEFLTYWLRSIQSVADAGKKLAGNVVLVLTHLDMISSTLSHRSAEQLKEKITDIIREHKLPYIPSENIHLVDNTSKSERMFENLKFQLKQMIQHLSSWGAERPIKWLKLEADMKETIDKKTQKPVKYLTHEEVSTLAQTYSMSTEELNTCLLLYAVRATNRVPAGSCHFSCLTDPSQSVVSFPCIRK